MDKREEALLEGLRDPELAERVHASGAFVVPTREAERDALRAQYGRVMRLKQIEAHIQSLIDYPDDEPHWDEADYVAIYLQADE